jgi:hypothetical protein
VQVKILDCDPANERMKLTFDLDEEVADGPRGRTARGEAVADIASGSFVDVEVVEVKNGAVEVVLVDHGRLSVRRAASTSHHMCFTLFSHTLVLSLLLLL